MNSFIFTLANSALLGLKQGGGGRQKVALFNKQQEKCKKIKLRPSNGTELYRYNINMEMATIFSPAGFLLL